MFNKACIHKTDCGVWSIVNRGNKQIFFQSDEYFYGFLSCSEYLSSDFFDVFQQHLLDYMHRNPWCMIMAKINSLQEERYLSGIGFLKHNSVMCCDQEFFAQEIIPKNITIHYEIEEKQWLDLAKILYKDKQIKYSVCVLKYIYGLRGKNCFAINNFGDLVGVVSLFYWKNISWICGLLVDPSFQNKGIGRLLINAIMSDTKGRFFLSAKEKSQPFYERLAFSKVDNYMVKRILTKN